VEYYLKLGSNDFQLLKLKKKAVIAIFPDYHENIENFIKDENGFSWSPTKEEREFLNEAFAMIQKKI